MRATLTSSVAQSLAQWINGYAGKDELALKKMAYSLEVILLAVSKYIVVYSLAFFIGVFLQTLLINFAFGFIKRYSFGLHARNSIVCTTMCCILFVVIPWGITGVGIGNYIVLPIFFVIIFALYKYAPADTKAYPIVGVQRRYKLKKQAVCSGITLMVIALLVPDEAMKLLLSLGAGFQIVTILPLTYKILKRSVRNYETYECK